MGRPELLAALAESRAACRLTVACQNSACSADPRGRLPAMPAPILVRTQALPFAGDTWAADGSQEAPTAGLECICTASPVLWKITGYDGTSETSESVTDALTTVDARLVMRDPNPGGKLESATTTRLTDGGAPERALGTGLVDRDIAPGQRFFCGLVSVTHAGPAAAVRIVITSGAKLA